MNRLAREIQKQDKGDCFAFRGKLFRPERGVGRPGFSEIRMIEGSKCRSLFPGRYGQKVLGFRLLEDAGFNRRRAASMPKYRETEIQSCKRMAREAIKLSRQRRIDLEEVAIAYAEAAE